MRVKPVLFVAWLLAPQSGVSSAAAEALRFQSDFGPVTITVDADRSIAGTYPDYDGSLSGTLRADGVLDMVWLRSHSESRCDHALNGTFYWGRLYWKLKGDRAKGQWSYCEDPIGGGGEWNATLAAGDPATLPRVPVAPIAEGEIEEALGYDYGTLGPGGPVKKLAADFSCDGVNDAVVTAMNLNNPDGPFFDVSLMSKGTGSLKREFFRLDFGDSQRSLCAAEGAPPPDVSVVGPLESGEVRDMTGYEGFCGNAVRIDDGMCDAHYLLWSDTPYPDETGSPSHLVHFRN